MCFTRLLRVWTQASAEGARLLRELKEDTFQTAGILGQPAAAWTVCNLSLSLESSPTTASASHLNTEQPKDGRNPVHTPLGTPRPQLLFVLLPGKLSPLTLKSLVRTRHELKTKTRRHI